ncbi:hypothetical protein GYMLUDRAFT_254265 [Collybiopsis luxurians FD-317 M1]|nr:hypothetical protein GYMLUDRAFT_254265 [Collybiopsis luxurians FD-317 M1]
MFFSPDLLARRDSGFGLLWLAATLGSKSTFKKLPRRSVLSADITQLCELIAHPEEPLALRLSSNLMVGVARVYKIKQEIFMNDVTNCVSSLKKVVQDMQAPVARDTSHQMAQQQTRPGAITIAADPQAIYFMEFDTFIAARLGRLFEPRRQEQDGEDDLEYNPATLKKSRKKNYTTNSKPLPFTEEVRADLVTLKEHHDHLLSNSFDPSLEESQRHGEHSSQAEPAFALEDNLFPGIDEGLGIDFGLGDDLARELGEGWGASPIKTADRERMDFDDPLLEPMSIGSGQTGAGTDYILGDDFGATTQGSSEHDINRMSSVHPPHTPVRNQIIPGAENPPPSWQASGIFRPPSPANSFAQLLLSQDEQLPEPEPVPLADVTTNHRNDANKRKKPQKRTRLLLDARTELTDDELKIARAQYLSKQHDLRRDFEIKQAEKDSKKYVEDLIWAIPGGIGAPALIDFWQENFKVQVEARTGLIHLDAPDEREPPAKRRKVGESIEEFEDYNMQVDDLANEEFNQANEGEIGRAGNPNAVSGDRSRPYCPISDKVNSFEVGWINESNVEPILRSSEEPGQARQISRPPSDIGGNLSLDLGQQELSQRSSLFPWDNAGPSSSVDRFGGGSDRISIDRGEIRMRGSSFTRRESSLALSQTGSAGARGISPGDIGMRGSQIIGEDFIFSGVEPEDTQTMNTQTMNTNTQIDSQKSEMNLMTLERNSLNFLEYARMQQQAMPDGSESISFDVVVPKLTSTRHVAAAAFYHCLVLTTKKFLWVNQTEDHGTISMRVL